MNPVRSVFKNISVLLLGRVISQGAGIVYLAALARYIQPTGMGKLAIAMALVSTLILLPNFGLNQLIVRDVANNKTKANIYVPNALLLKLFLSIVFGVVIVGITQIIGYPYETTLIIYIYSLAGIFDALTDVAFSIFKAYEKMEYQAAIQTGRDLINIALSLTAIYLHVSLVGIVLITAAVNLIKVVVSLVVLRWRFVRPKIQFDQRLCRQLFVSALPFAALGVIATVNRQIDTILLSLYHPEQEVGWFSAANMLITYLLILPGIFLQAIFPVFSRLHGSSRDVLQKAYRTSFKYLLLLGFPLCVGTIVTADQVIALVFGPGFENAALALRILAFMLFWMFGFANGALLNATGGETFLAKIGGMGVAVNLAVALLLIPRFSFVGASIAGISYGGIFFFPITLACHKRLGIKLPYALAIKSLASSLFMGVIVAFSLRAQINLFVTVFAIAPIVYGVQLVALRAIDHEDMLRVSRLFRKIDDSPHTPRI